MYKFNTMALRIVLLSCIWMTDSRVLTKYRQGRLSLAEPTPSYYYTNINGVPGTYAFGYDVLDASTGNTQYRTEERYPNGTVVGSYGYLDANGRPMKYRYIADERGYRVSKVRPELTMTPTPAVNNVPMYNTKEDSTTWSRKKLQTVNQLQNQKTFNYENRMHQNIYYNNNVQKPIYYY